MVQVPHGSWILLRCGSWRWESGKGLFSHQASFSQDEHGLHLPVPFRVQQQFCRGILCKLEDGCSLALCNSEGHISDFDSNIAKSNVRDWWFPFWCSHKNQHHSPDQEIRHTLCEAQSAAEWTRHGHHSYHQSYPYAHMNRETHIWLKFFMNWLISGLHFIMVTRDRVCLVYSLMMVLPISIRVVLKSTILKARAHRRWRFAFGILITQLCRHAGVPKEPVEYMAPFFTTPIDVTKAKGTELFHGPTLTIAKHIMRDDMVTTWMYGLEMLPHKNGCRASSQENLD